MAAKPLEVVLCENVTFDGGYAAAACFAEGAFSHVFEGVHISTGTPVAIKVLKMRSGAQGAAEFDNEVELLARLSTSPNVVNLVSSGTQVFPLEVQGQSTLIPLKYLVLELASASLASLLADRDAVDWEDRLTVFRGAVRGLHQMHIARIAHRDMKSDNVLLFPGKKDSVAKVSDFGRSRDTRRGSLTPVVRYAYGRGDPQFAPPECLWLLGTPDPMSFALADLYLAGSLFFELATGQALTAFVFGSVMRMFSAASALPVSLREGDYRAKEAETRERYEAAYSLFERELPGPIRSTGTALLRQLTDPNPALRIHKRRYGAVDGDPWSLEWLLGKIDSMERALRMAELQARRLRTTQARRVARQGKSAAK